MEAIEGLSVSYSQQRLWYLHHARGAAATHYNIVRALRLRGALNREALQSAINSIVERHNSLRARFVEIKGAVHQVIAPCIHLELPTRDLRLLTREQQDAQISEEFERETHCLFNLFRDLLLRVRLFHVAEQEHILVRTTHSIVFDHRSNVIFDRELIQLYESFSAGCGDPLGRTPIQYSDYALWQREWLDSGGLDESIEYWKQRLQGIPKRLRLPTGDLPSGIHTSDAETHSFILTAEETAAVMAFGLKYDITLLMTLLAALFVFLLHYCNQRDIVVGIPTSHRHGGQLDEIVGLFSNRLLLRMKLRPGMTVAELVEEVRSATVGGYQHQHVPFDWLIEALSLDRSASPFQITFELEDVQPEHIESTTLAIEPFQIEAPRVDADLHVRAFLDSGRLRFSWLHKPGLFRPDGVEQIARHYVDALSAITRNREMTIDDINLMKPDAGRRLCGDCNLREREFGSDPAKIESLLLEHPAVAQAAVVRDDRISNKRLVAYVVPALIVKTELTEKDIDPLQNWLNTYDALYTEKRPAAWDQDFRGWNSSYDGQPIPLEDMREWRDETVARILELRPRRVLEIGAGSGLLLSKIAPFCETYWATDFSPAAVQFLQERVAHLGALGERIHLKCQAADVTQGLPAKSFDTIILNSLVQYFPNPEYLLTVLRGAMNLLTPAGHIFVGDVRNLALLRCFRTSVELAKAAQGTTIDSLRETINLKMLSENELLLRPEFFATLPQTLADIAGVDIRLKQGRRVNEMTRYRYDVVLHKSPDKPVTFEDVQQICWGREVNDISSLGIFLAEKLPEKLRICAVPNRRLSGDYKIMQLVECSETLSDVRDADVSSTGYDPEEFQRLAKQHGYWTAATWTCDDHSRFDVLFFGRNEVLPPTIADVYQMKRSALLETPANILCTLQELQVLIETVRTHVKNGLPANVTPPAILLTDSLPVCS